MSNSSSYPPPPPATSRIRLVLLATWTALTVATIGFVAAVGSNCPNADEWEFVPALTGHEPLGPWLWAQHNEHRLPLPRLVYYCLFQLTHDFRTGSLVQIALLSATSLGLMTLAARLRGKPYWTDIFFPVSLVHVGHWENLLIGYNICFAFILVLETALGLVALFTTRETVFRSGVKAGALMVLLCLCGGGGVVAAMPVALWLAYLAVQEWNDSGRTGDVSRRVDRVIDPATHVAGSPEAEIVNPIDASASPEEKVRQLQRLTEANQPLVDSFLNELDARFGTRSNSNVKTPASILTKANRPSIRAKKPWHDVEHIRDSFRFKTVMKDMRELPAILHEVEAKLGATIIERDTAKFLRPELWGWRIVAFDLRMPNGQLVEYYLPVEEVERAKNEGNHELFEKWRNLNWLTLTSEQYREMQYDLETGNRIYQAAFDGFLERSGATEQELRAVVAIAAASPAETGVNSSFASSTGKANPGFQVSPPSQVEAANPSSSTNARPSPSRDFATTAIGTPPLSTDTVAETAAGAKSSTVRAAILLAFSAFPFVYLAIYLQGYHRPGHHPELGEGGLAVGIVTIQVLTTGFGSGVGEMRPKVAGTHIPIGWPVVAIGMLIVGWFSLKIVARRFRSLATRPESIGLIAFGIGIVGVALVIGMGRAGLTQDAILRNGQGLSSRYSYLTWPLFALAYLFWVRQGGWAGKWIPVGLCTVAAIVFTLNMVNGMVKGSSVHSVLMIVESEAREGVPPEQIVRNFHIGKDHFQQGQEQRAIRAIPMLREAGVGAFAEGRK